MSLWSQLEIKVVLWTHEAEALVTFTPSSVTTDYYYSCKNLMLSFLLATWVSLVWSCMISNVHYVKGVTQAFKNVEANEYHTDCNTNKYWITNMWNK